MKKIISIVTLLIVMMFVSSNARGIIFIYNNTPLQYNFSFNNGYYCGISATSPYMNVMTGPGTDAASFASFGGILMSYVKVNTGLTPHTPLGMSMELFVLGATFSGFPSSVTSIGQYGLMTSTFTIDYGIVGSDIFITINPS